MLMLLLELVKNELILVVVMLLLKVKEGPLDTEVGWVLLAQDI